MQFSIMTSTQLSVWGHYACRAVPTLLCMEQRGNAYHTRLSSVAQGYAVTLLNKFCTWSWALTHTLQWVPGPQHFQWPGTIPAIHNICCPCKDAKLLNAGGCRPVVDSQGLDHDDGIEGALVERLFVLRRKGQHLDGTPLYISAQAQKDKNASQLQVLAPPLAYVTRMCKNYAVCYKKCWLRDMLAYHTLSFH